ncbi:MAG: glycoside hydrolase family 88 protein [Anaeroplasmataceae bacterium]|nr:glycoside hydrolase family 88 protein [Anaeroplasmataceae bacterium]
MKKIVLICLLLCGILFSCGGNTEKEQIHFDIAENITIELDEYSSYYNFSDKITAYNNEEKIAYRDLSITLSEGSSISLGVQDFIVSYKLNGKEYKQTFQVKFIDSHSTILVHMLKDVRTFKIENGKNLDSLNIVSSTNDYTVTGFYKDKNYTEVFDKLQPITQDTEVYARMEYNLNYTSPQIETSEIVTNLDTYINYLVNSTFSFRPAWNQEGFKGRWNYIDGVFLNSIVNLYYETNNPRLKDFFINYINYYIDYDGNFINPETGEKTGYRSGELDSVCESRILFDAYDMTGDERYLKAISKTYQELMSMPIAEGTTNFSHKVSYPNQIWLDGMYMYVPFLARYAKSEGDRNTFLMIKMQYEYIRRTMFDETKKLYYHGHDTTKSIFWADQTSGNSKSFWLRSNGWFIVSLVDAIEYFPEGDNKEYLKALLVEAVEGILQYKDAKTNMFYQLVDKGPTAYVVSKNYLSGLNNTAYGTSDAIIHNYLESSGSSMVAYTLLKGARLGYLKAEYQDLGKDIFEGVYGYSYKDGSLNDICITAGLGPESNEIRDGSIEYYLAEPVGKNDAKGVGPFIMAYLEYASLKEQLPKWYNVTFHRFDGSYEEAVYTGRPLDTIVSTELIGYTFEGYYFDSEYKNPVPEGYQITKDVDIYLYFKKIPTAYEILLDSDSILLNDDFDSYDSIDALPEFQEWGTKGIYYHINDKNNPGVDKELNHILLGDGTAYLFDDSEYDGTQLIIDSGSITSGLIKGYMEIELQRPGNGWTFFQMHGTRADGTFGEIFGIRFQDGELKYRINNGTAQVAESYIYPHSRWYTIEYEYDLNQKKLSVKVNDAYIVTDLSMETASSFAGIKVVTSDGWVHDSEGNLFHWLAKVDNIVIVVEE